MLSLFVNHFKKPLKIVLFWKQVNCQLSSPSKVFFSLHTFKLSKKNFHNPSLLFRCFLNYLVRSLANSLKVCSTSSVMSSKNISYASLFLLATWCIEFLHASSFKKGCFNAFVAWGKAFSPNGSKNFLSLLELLLVPQNFVARDLPSRFPITLMASPRQSPSSTETKKKGLKKWQQHHSFFCLKQPVDQIVSKLS